MGINELLFMPNVTSLPSNVHIRRRNTLVLLQKGTYSSRSGWGRGVLPSARERLRQGSAPLEVSAQLPPRGNT